MTDPSSPSPGAPTDTNTDTNSAAGRIFRNARALISGNTIGGVLSLAYLAIAARSLGPTEMGYLVLAHAYVLVIASLARFQSWQAVIRFGTPMLGDDDRDQFKSLLRFTVKMDIIGSVLAIALALGFAGFVGRLMGWPDDAMALVYLYCVATPFLIPATPSGVLRLFDRFRLLGWQLTILPGVRFVGAIILLFTGGGLTEFLGLWILSAVVDGVSFWVLGWRALKQENRLPGLRRAAGSPKPDPRWLGFMLKTNFSSSIELAYTNLPVLVVGAVLGGAASGFFQLATNLTNLIAHPTNMLNQATFPELSRVHNELGKPAMRQLAWRSILAALKVAVPLVFLYILLRDWLATAIGGSAFAPAGALIALMAGIQVWRIVTVVVESAVLATGKAGFVLFAQSAGAVVTIAVLVVCLTAIGPAGAPLAIAAGLTTITGLCIMSLISRRG